MQNTIKKLSTDECLYSHQWRSPPPPAVARSPPSTMLLARSKMADVLINLAQPNAFRLPKASRRGPCPKATISCLHRTPLLGPKNQEGGLGGTKALGHQRSSTEGGGVRGRRRRDTKTSPDEKKGPHRRLRAAYETAVDAAVKQLMAEHPGAALKAIDCAHRPSDPRYQLIFPQTTRIVLV